MTAPPTPARPATILRLPVEHHRLASARITVWRIMASPKPAPDAPRTHPGGWFAPRDRKDDPA